MSRFKVINITLLTLLAVVLIAVVMFLPHRSREVATVQSVEMIKTEQGHFYKLYLMNPGEKEEIYKVVGRRAGKLTGQQVLRVKPCSRAGYVIQVPLLKEREVVRFEVFKGDSPKPISTNEYVIR